MTFLRNSQLIAFKQQNNKSVTKITLTNKGSRPASSSQMAVKHKPTRFSTKWRELKFITPSGVVPFNCLEERNQIKKAK